MESSPNDPPRRTRIRQQEVVTELSQQALKTDDLDTLLRDATAAVAETLDVEYCGVLEWKPGRETGVLRQGLGWRSGIIGATVLATRDSLVGYTLRTAEPVIVDDLRTDERFSGSTLLTDHGVKSGISVVIGPADDPWGVLGAYATDRRAFAESDGDFVWRVANVLALVLERLRREPEEMRDRISDAFFALDERWRFTSLNDRAHELLDPDGRTLVGERVWEALPGTTGRAFKSAAERVRAEREAHSYERYHPEPIDAWLEVRVYPTETGLSVYCRDVTDRRARDRELERLERRFDAIFDDSNVFAGFLDPDGTVRDVNETAMEYVDESRADVIGEPFWETAWWSDGAGEASSGTDGGTPLAAREPANETGSPSETSPDDEGVTLARVERRTADDRESSGREPSTELRFAADEHRGSVGVRSDVRRWVERAATGERVAFEVDLGRADGRRCTLDGAFRPVTNDEGEVVSIAVSARDVTANNEYERRLEESEQRYQTLVEHFPNGTVALVDRDLRYVTFGGTPLGDSGLTRADLEGSLLRDTMPSTLRDVIVPRYEAALDGETAAFERTIDDRHYQFHFVPVRDEDGDVFAAMGMSQDVTEQKERERKLEQSNERLERFAYAASHDLQEPLRMVTSYLHLLEKRHGDAFDEDGEEFLAFAVDGADRMREMIDGLLKYSRVETQGEPFEPVELNAVLEDARQDLRLRIDETDAEITATDLPRVEGDASQLRQVFQNLLSNAITYSGDGPPRIRIDADRRRGELIVSVSDEGIGIDPDDHGRVFTIFDRLHSRKDYEGSGIGLALCERIVERHGGEIWVESEPGEGATFSFTLPAFEA